MLPHSLSSCSLTGSLHPVEASSSLPPSVPADALTCRVVVPPQKSGTSKVPASRLVAPDQAPLPDRWGPKEATSEDSQRPQQGAVRESLDGGLQHVGVLQETPPLLLLAVRWLL